MPSEFLITPGLSAGGQHRPHQLGGWGHHPGHLWSHHLHRHRSLQVGDLCDLRLNSFSQESNPTKTRLVKINITDKIMCQDEMLNDKSQ